MSRRARIVLTAASLTAGLLVAACGTAPLPATPDTASAPTTPVTASSPLIETLDGFELAGPLTLTADEFHRLEVTARDTWRMAHPGETLSGYELRASGAQPGESGTPSVGPDDYLVVVTVAGTGARHVLPIHCDPATFPAVDSCS